MIYTRHELREMIESQPENVQAELIALAWHGSGFEPNTINGERYGLCQIRLQDARKIGFRGEPLALLDAGENIRVASQVLMSIGIVEYCGYEMSHQMFDIISLAKWWRAHPGNLVTDELSGSDGKGNGVNENGNRVNSLATHNS